MFLLNRLLSTFYLSPTSSYPPSSIMYHFCFLNLKCLLSPITPNFNIINIMAPERSPRIIFLQRGIGKLSVKAWQGIQYVGLIDLAVSITQESRNTSKSLGVSHTLLWF